MLPFVHIQYEHLSKNGKIAFGKQLNQANIQCVTRSVKEVGHDGTSLQYSFSNFKTLNTNDFEFYARDFILKLIQLLYKTY
jgi:hypothetical protein